MIKFLGTLKGVVQKSKEDNDGRITHYVDLKFEVVEGQERVHELVEEIKKITEVCLTSKQPSLLKK